MKTPAILRLSLLAALLGTALCAHAGQKLVYGFDDPFTTVYGYGPISIATGDGYSESENFDFRAFYGASVQANSDASGAQRLGVDLGSSLLKYGTGPDVDGTLTVELHKAIFSGPGGNSPFYLDGAFEALHLDFAGLDHDVAVSYQSYGNVQALSFSGSGVVKAGTRGIDIPLGSGAHARSVYGLTVVLDGPKGTNFQLDAISATTSVPEPASLLALGVPAFALLRRRKRA